MSQTYVTVLTINSRWIVRDQLTILLRRWDNREFTYTLLKNTLEPA